jgi:hypothetical protein
LIAHGIQMAKDELGDVEERTEQGLSPTFMPQDEQRKATGFEVYTFPENHKQLKSIYPQFGRSNHCARLSSILHGLLPFFCTTPPPFQQRGLASRSDNDAPPPLGRRRVHRFVSSDFGKPLITRQPEHLLGLGRVHPSRADFDGVRKRAAQDEVRRPRGKWGSL